MGGGCACGELVNQQVSDLKAPFTDEMITFQPVYLLPFLCIDPNVCPGPSKAEATQFVFNVISLASAN